VPYDKPDPDDACANCVRGPVAYDCGECVCYNPVAMREMVRRGYNAEHNWEQGYHWQPSEWTCDLCGSRAMVGHRGPVIVADGVTICDRGECLGAILRGLEAMRKAGMAIYGPGESFVLAEGQQEAAEFYSELAKAGREDG
jgi:hypothetical protein